jgi:hypothetical protein
MSGRPRFRAVDSLAARFRFAAHSTSIVRIAVCEVSSVSS